MADLHSLLSGRLENLRRAPGGGWTSACPVCRAEGSDSGKCHLRIFASSAFNCAKAGPDDKAHNKAVRAWIYQDADPDTLAALEVEFIDPEPKLDIDKIYPEEMISRLTPDYRYWTNRGISEEVVRRMEGGLAPRDERNKLTGYFTFPVRDDKRRIIGWASRLVDENSFGHKHKHLVKTGRCVFPVHVAGESIRATRKVVLVEGLADLMSLQTVGMWNVLAVLGLNLNARVLGFLASVNPTHIVISTNADTERVNKATGRITHPGQDAADKLRAKLVPFFGEERVVVRFPRSEGCKDWNETLQKCPDDLRAFKAEVDAL